MSIKSLLCGIAGDYELFGIPVCFIQESEEPSSPWIKVASLITHPHIYTLFHEMGHALAFRLLSGKTPDVNIFLSNAPFVIGGQIDTPLFFPQQSLKSWQWCVIEAAGPITGIAFSQARLLVAKIFAKYLPKLALISQFLELASTYSIWYEQMTVFHSILEGDDGDFGRIQKRGKIPLLLAMAAFVSQQALTAFFGRKILLATTIPSAYTMTVLILAKMISAIRKNSSTSDLH